MAELDGRIVGMAVTTMTNDDRASLDMLAVDSQYSGCGIGSQLLERSMHSARLSGATTMRLGAARCGSVR